jgi:hypothetical protein
MLTRCQNLLVGKLIGPFQLALLIGSTSSVVYSKLPEE